MRLLVGDVLSLGRVCTCSAVCASKHWVVLRCAWNLASKLLERLALRLWNEKSGEDTQEHEEGEDFEDVVQPWAGDCLGSTASAERSKSSLGDDGTDLARGSGDTVASRTVAGWETLARNDEGGCVRAEVEEELGENVAGQQSVRSDLVVCETHDAEEDGEDDETHELNWLATNGVNECDSHPVTWNGTSAHEDDVSDSNVVEEVVCVGLASVANSLENRGVVETDTVEGDIEEEPGASSSEKNLSVSPLTDVAEEVLPGWLWGLELRSGVTHSGDTGDLIRNTLSGTRKVGLDIRATLDNIAGDIESVARSLWDGETEVEGNASWNSTHSNDDTPHLVDSKVADTIASSLSGDRGSNAASSSWNSAGALKRLLEANSDNESDDTSGELTETLVGEDSSHHGTSPLGGSELRCDDSGKWVVTTDTDTHENTPEDDDTDDVDSWRVCGESLGESCEDDDDQFETVHLLTSDNIGEETKTKLTNDGTSRSGDLDSGIRGDWELSLAGDWTGLVVDHTKHGGHDTDGEDVVGIGEETNTSNNDSADMVPT